MMKNRLVQLIRRLCFEIIRLVAGGERAARFLGVRVGKGCRILTSRFGSEPWLIDIGDRVTITNGVTILTHDGATWLVRDEKGRRYRYGRVSIGNDVFIGINAIIMPGVRIGNRVIIGAGSVVTRSIPDGLMVAGNPARVIGLSDRYWSRALAEFPSAMDLKGTSYRERVLSVVENGFAPPLEDPNSQSNAPKQ